MKNTGGAAHRLRSLYRNATGCSGDKCLLLSKSLQLDPTKCIRGAGEGFLSQWTFWESEVLEAFLTCQHLRVSGCFWAQFWRSGGNQLSCNYCRCTENNCNDIISKKEGVVSTFNLELLISGPSVTFHFTERIWGHLPGLPMHLVHQDWKATSNTPQMGQACTLFRTATPGHRGRTHTRSAHFKGTARVTKPTFQCSLWAKSTKILFGFMALYGSFGWKAGLFMAQTILCKSYILQDIGKCIFWMEFTLLM